MSGLVVARRRMVWPVVNGERCQYLPFILTITITISSTCLYRGGAHEATTAAWTRESAIADHTADLILARSLTLFNHYFPPPLGVPKDSAGFPPCTCYLPRQPPPPSDQPPPAA